MTTSRTPEFDLIAKHFTRKLQPVRRASLGIGDDCALVDVTPGKQLAISTDTLVAGVHFFADADATTIGHKALAVNLSDLAAMGAAPRFFTLAITLPEKNDVWLQHFAEGMFRLADQFDIELIGGDTTRGALSITITVMGQVAPSIALQRDHAKAGDEIWVSGTLGGAALALKHLQGKVTLKPNVLPRALKRLHTPEPRVALGMRLIGHAHAAIDVSDGLVADLGHICERSQLHAEIDWSKIPLHPSLLSVGPEIRLPAALSGGDDYELCFTAKASQAKWIAEIAEAMELPLTRIGVMKNLAPGFAPQVTVIDEKGLPISPNAFGGGGFDHFAAAKS
jgi:thiamine-monophosphate kinase